MASSAAMYQINTRTMYFPKAVNITLDYVAKANINKANSDWNTTVQYNLDKVDKLTCSPLHIWVVQHHLEEQ
jgi:hypothetical protein